MAGNQMQLEDWLDDLCVRFIINLPQEDLSSVARICFQVEEAQWFYEDFIRPLDASLPSMTLRTFCLRIFQHCPLLASFSVENHSKAFEEFLEYKTRVPVRGAILLNHAMDSAVLVKAWKKGASWSFPRGKINKDEDDLDCAVREVWEETGLDLRAAGLVPTEAKPKYIEIPIKQQQLRLYIFRNVPMDTNFQPQTRKEISKIQWYKLSELPTFRKKGGQNHEAPEGPQANKFYMVAPFLVPLKKWVSQQKRLDERKAATGRQGGLHPYLPVDEVVTEDDGWTQPEVADSYHTPAIETLDGATQELQRLLKMQPPMQGLQPAAAQGDKGSALLSILQAKSASETPTTARNAGHLPHTPQGYTGADIPQPRNPHHHTNQHHIPLNVQQPPPPFQASHGQGAAGWNYQHNQVTSYQAQTQAYTSMAEQRTNSSHAILVHPQPLPPQVQRAMFNNSVFQDSAAQGSYSGNVSNVHQAHHRVEQQLPQAGPQPPAGANRPTHLTGQSMALLDAFKRDSLPVEPTQQGGNNASVRAGYNAPAHESKYPHHIGLRPDSLHAAAPPFEHQKSPTELAGSFVAAPAHHHRASLLGMFKDGPSEAASTQSQTVVPQHGDSAQEPSPRRQTQRDSVAQYQQQSHTGVSSLSASRHPSHGNLDLASGLPLEQLSIHAGPSQINKAFNGGSTVPRHSPSLAAAPAPHPRILQRGQDPRAFGLGDQPPISPKTLLHGFTGSSAPGHLTGSPTMGASTARRSEAPAEQKRQLLSLFGKQQSPAGGLPQEAAPTDPASFDPRPRVASMASGTSSRLGRQTPISPADQSFLLDYLQSVTNSAGR
ncbi:hypothetical protein S40285_00393 [Stachybotrys chlorohalonatus IBT 40285]|uniref:Nudix hydrolase domain-containing protein n=1 Tax=Stachybotrys chlorohalonatus (strain IBT 40285) TaxID=1283841 RepID=A0A084QHK8_STAC4|nr:hypothetical protein S40285_00393 [Stachybotrys chlorohalonata IBT 40285]